MKEEKSKHAELQNTAIRWLYNRGCSVFAQEVPTKNGIADAIGIKKGDTYYIEAKSSRSDLMCKKQKIVYEVAIGNKNPTGACYYHNFDGGMYANNPNRPRSECHQCIEDEAKRGDTGIDFYYLILANSVKIKHDEYPMFGVLNEQGELVRRAKRMKKAGDSKELLESISHVLVYKVFGKLYQN